jgi:hypothetical protein
MPGYIKNTPHKFQHPLPKRPQYAPHHWTVPSYGQRIQYAPLPDAAPPETAAEIIRILPLPQPPLRALGRTKKSKRQESHPTKECARARVRCLKTEPKYYYYSITLVMT